jgi:hypothetical protein
VQDDLTRQDGAGQGSVQRKDGGNERICLSCACLSVCCVCVVLRHPLGLEYFIRCLHGEKLGEENIKFWVKINELKALTDRARQMEKSHQIYDQFVRAGAPDQVSIDAQVVIRMSGALDKAQHGSTLLSMARAQQKIEVILRGDSFKYVCCGGVVCCVVGGWCLCVMAWHAVDRLIRTRIES